MTRWLSHMMVIVILGAASPAVAQQTMRIVDYSEKTQRPASEYIFEFDEIGLLTHGIQRHLEVSDIRVESEILLDISREGDVVTIDSVTETQHDNGSTSQSTRTKRVVFGGAGDIRVSGKSASGEFSYAIEIDGCNWGRTVERDGRQSFIGMNRVNDTQWHYRNEAGNITTLFEISSGGELTAFSSGRNEAWFHVVEQMEDSGISIARYQNRETNEGSVLSRVEVYGAPLEVPIHIAIASYEIVFTYFYEIRYELLPVFFSAAICGE